MTTIVIPILYLTEYSKRAVIDIKHKAALYPQLQFLIVCYSDVKSEVKEIFENSTNNIVIISCSIKSSNYLRLYSLRFINTYYVYYQDCDDIVDYEILLAYSSSREYIVTCFNIQKHIYDDKGVLLKQFPLYRINTGLIRNIQNLPTNIVNKLIPLTALKQVSFYNIPFAQDLSLSFQLYDIVDHTFVPQVTYIYENNSLSTSGLKKTKYSTLLRVVAIKRILSKICEKNKNNVAYVNFRYEVLLSTRFAFLNIPYMPKVSCRIFNICTWGPRNVLKYLYYYLKSCFLSTKIYLSKLLNIPKLK